MLYGENDMVDWLTPDRLLPWLTVVQVAVMLVISIDTWLYDRVERKRKELERQVKR